MRTIIIGAGLGIIAFMVLLITGVVLIVACHDWYVATHCTMVLGTRICQ